MDQSKYLSRIGYTGELKVSLQLLKQLQRLHLLHIPFENLDIHFGRKISLAGSYSKVVENGRGGFCYELNGTFFKLLKQLGFKVRMISARVYNKERGFGQEFDHMAIIAEIDDVHYLVDVGFGEFSLEPLQLQLDILQHDEHGDFQIERYDYTYLVVNRLQDGALVPKYIFTEIARELNDFQAMAIYHQTNKESPFTQKRVCSMPTESGRITITDNGLKVREYDRVTETEFKDEDSFHQALWDYFRMKLSVSG